MRSKVLTISKSEIQIVPQDSMELRGKMLAIEEKCFLQVVENMRLRKALYDLQCENNRLHNQFEIMERNFDRTEYLLRSLQTQMNMMKKSLFKWFSLDSGNELSADEKTIKNVLKQMMLDEVDSE